MSRILYALPVLALLVSCAPKQPLVLEGPPGILDQEPTMSPFAQATLPPSPVPHGPPAPPAVPVFVPPHVPVVSALRPSEVIEQANAGSRFTPSLAGYTHGQSSVLVYPIVPGRTYEVYSAPGAPTTLLLPGGETLAAPLTLNPEEWEVGSATMATRQALILRPMTPGVVGTSPLLFQSGLVLFVWVKSLVTTSMAAVSWE